MPTIKLNNGRVILYDGKVSCRCCSCCEKYDIDFFLYGPDIVSETLLATIRPNPDTPPQPEWTRDIRPSCARWVCANVINGVVSDTEQYGGPTTRNLDLTKLLWSYIPVPSGSGCHIYRFDFYGWVERLRKPKTRSTERVWRQSSDTYFKIYKEVYITTY